jgi:hypothetical protein
MNLATSGGLDGVEAHGVPGSSTPGWKPAARFRRRPRRRATPTKSRRTRSPTLAICWTGISDRRLPHRPPSSPGRRPHLGTCPRPCRLHSGRTRPLAPLPSALSPPFRFAFRPLASHAATECRCCIAVASAPLERQSSETASSREARRHRGDLMNAEKRLVLNGELREPVSTPFDYGMSTPPSAAPRSAAGTAQGVNWWRLESGSQRGPRRVLDPPRTLPTGPSPAPGPGAVSVRASLRPLRSFGRGLPGRA